MEPHPFFFHTSLQITENLATIGSKAFSCFLFALWQGLLLFNLSFTWFKKSALRLLLLLLFPNAVFVESGENLPPFSPLEEKKKKVTPPSYVSGNHLHAPLVTNKRYKSRYKKTPKIFFWLVECKPRVPTWKNGISILVSSIIGSHRSSKTSHNLMKENISNVVLCKKLSVYLYDTLATLFRFIYCGCIVYLASESYVKFKLSSKFHGCSPQGLSSQ